MGSRDDKSSATGDQEDGVSCLGRVHLAPVAGRDEVKSQPGAPGHPGFVAGQGVTSGGLGLVGPVKVPPFFGSEPGGNGVGHGFGHGVTWYEGK